MPPHSATVRGTLDNLKTKEAMKKPSNKTQLGDPGSLKPEHADDDPVPDRTAQDGGSTSSRSSDSPSSSSDPYRQNEHDKPHSARVRGTLSNPHRETQKSADGKPRSMLGDPASLRAEKGKTEVTEDDRGAGPPRDEAEMKKAAEKRKENEAKGGKTVSKL